MGIEKQKSPTGDEETYTLDLVRRGGTLVLKHKGLIVARNAPYLGIILEAALEIEDIKRPLTDEEKAASRALHDQLCAGEGPDYPLHVGIGEAEAWDAQMASGLPEQQAPADAAASPSEAQVA